MDDYGSLFEQHLNAVLSGEAELERERMFREFLQGACFFCESCGREFEVRNTENVDEGDKVLCGRCRKGRRP